MDSITYIRQEIGDDWIPDIYTRSIRPLRTRSFEMDIPERQNSPEIFETLLGMELKVGRRRFACPDLNTARYLYVFASIGCRKVAVPYDITVLGALAKQLNSAWNRSLQLCDLRTAEISPQQKGRTRSALVRAIRDEVNAIGAGELMPLFNRPTKQRED
jgi:hypothetical protein